MRMRYDTLLSMNAPTFYAICSLLLKAYYHLRITLKGKLSAICVVM